MTDLEFQVSALLPTTPVEDMIGLDMAINGAIRRLQELKRELHERHLLPRLESIGGITIGDVRYYAAYEKRTRCLENSECAEAVLKATGGDLAQFSACLSAGAFLPGACRKALPAGEFTRLFETTTRLVLKDGTAAKKQLQMTDQRFVNQPAAQAAHSEE